MSLAEAARGPPARGRTPARASLRSSTEYAEEGRIAFEVAGDPAGAPLLVCHGLADARLCGRTLAPVASELGVMVIAPDRPGTGLSEARRLERVVDWVADARRVLDAAGVGRAAVLGISGGGPFAAACAAELGDRVSRLILATALGRPEWGRRGMAGGERFSLLLAAHAPGLGSRFMGGLARLPSPAFMRLAIVGMPSVDRRTLSAGLARQDFLDGYREAFRRGTDGVAQDLRLLTRSWGFELESIRTPTHVHHGDADTTVPIEHAQRYAAAISGAELVIHVGEGHFSLLARRAREVLM